MFMICLRTEFYMPSISFLLFISTKLKISYTAGTAAREYALRYPGRLYPDANVFRRP